MNKFFIVGFFLFLTLASEGFAGPMRLRKPQPHSSEYYRLLAERDRKDKLEARLRKEQVQMAAIYFFSVVGAVGFGFLAKRIDDSYQQRRKVA